MTSSDSPARSATVRRFEDGELEVVLDDGGRRDWPRVELAGLRMLRAGQRVRVVERDGLPPLVGLVSGA